jgi:hypothetical protein
MSNSSIITPGKYRRMSAKFVQSPYAVEYIVIAGGGGGGPTGGGRGGGAGALVGIAQTLLEKILVAGLRQGPQ